MNRRPLRRLQADEGFTLVELAVGSLLLTIVVSVALSTLLTVQRTAIGSQRRGYDLSAAQTGIDAAMKHLRSAVVPPGGVQTTPFDSFTANDITFYSYANASLATGPRRVRLWVSAAGVLTAAVTVPNPRPPGATTWTYPSTPTWTRVLARGVQNTTAVFTPYCSKALPEQTCTAAGQPMINAVAVQVRLAVRGDGPQPATELVNRVRLSNLDLR